MDVDVDVVVVSRWLHRHRVSRKLEPRCDILRPGRGEAHVHALVLEKRLGEGERLDGAESCLSVSRFDGHPFTFANAACDSACDTPRVGMLFHGEDDVVRCVLARCLFDRDIDRIFGMLSIKTAGHKCNTREG